ncbi:MAG: hypothetical protein V3S03_03275, partial [Vicinamibacteria bacterium]
MAFLQIPEDLLLAIAGQKLASSDLRVLLLVISKRFAWPADLATDRISQRYLERALGVDRRRIRDAIGRLQAAEILRVEPGRGTRPSRFDLRPPATWAQGAPLVGAPGPPGQGEASGLTPVGNAPASGVADRPASGVASAPEKKTREERALSWVGAVNARLAQYPHPTTGATKRIDDVDPARAKRFAEIAAEHPDQPLELVLVAGIDGFVALRGLGIQEGGWDPWDHLELDSIVSRPKLQKNLEAEAQARALGWIGPLRHGAHKRRAPRRRAEKRQASPAIPILELVEMSPEERWEAVRA